MPIICWNHNNHISIYSVFYSHSMQECPHPSLAQIQTVSFHGDYFSQISCFSLFSEALILLSSFVSPSPSPSPAFHNHHYGNQGIYFLLSSSFFLLSEHVSKFSKFHAFLTFSVKFVHSFLPLPLRLLFFLLNFVLLSVRF